MDDVGVRVTGGGELVAERILGLVEQLEWLLEERALLDLLHGIGDLAHFSLGFLCRLVADRKQPQHLLAVLADAGTADGLFVLLLCCGKALTRICQRRLNFEPLQLAQASRLRATCPTTG